MARLFGYSTQSPEQLIASGLAGEPTTARPGDFTAVSEGESPDRSLLLVSSPIAAFPCYYAYDSQRRLHLGGDVFTVARTAGLSWEWNLRAIRSLGLFGHTTGRDTLHARVFRAPPDKLIRHSGTTTEESDLGFWLATASASRHSTPEEALEALKRIFLRDLGPRQPLLSLSAGFDSRLLLALCLWAGVHPRTATMGPHDGSDAAAATALARIVGLPHTRIELRPDDYLTQGHTISRLTSGSKTAGNWHTYLYAREASAAADEVHLVGSNGEFARSFYLPGQSALIGSLIPSHALRVYWTLRIARRRTRFPLWKLVSGQGPWTALRCTRGLPRSGADLSSALDHFYATERVRHFIGNGLALYAAVGRPRSPFLDPEFLDVARHLTRRLRLKSRYHQWAISRLAPELLEVPFNRPIDAQHSKGYSPFSAVRHLRRARDVVMDCDGLDDVVPRQLRERLLASGTEAEFELLLTLAYAAYCARSTAA